MSYTFWKKRELHEYQVKYGLAIAIVKAKDEWDARHQALFLDGFRRARFTELECEKVDD